ncbi:MAG TPA: redox-sensing transcriptional repressor Rex [bacterium]
MFANKKVIFRLSQYRQALFKFKELGFAKVFSDTLGDAIGVTSVQVRKDFSLFGITGNKRGGYQVDALIKNLQSILGKDQPQEVILVGAGDVGSALIKYKNFENESIKIVAGFDIDPAKINCKLRVPVLPMSDMGRFVRERGIKVGIIAVPDVAAQEVFDQMVACGIQGILNFAPIRFRGADGFVINNVNLQIEIENIIYFVNAMQKPANLIHGDPA